MTVAGTTLVLVGTLSMFAASLVLLLSSPDKLAAAFKQGIIPALGAIAIIIGAVLWGPVTAGVGNPKIR